jgi:hypothetical protein
MKTVRTAGIALLLSATAALAQSTHEQLMARSEGERFDLLGAVISSTGQQCEVTAHTFKGMYKGDAYHLAVCRSGNAYLVTIHPDKQGSTTVLDCALTEQFGADCFKEWE